MNSLTLLLSLFNLTDESVAIKYNLFLINYNSAFRLLLLSYMTHILTTPKLTIYFYSFNYFFYLRFCFLDLLTKFQLHFWYILLFILFFQCLTEHLLLLLLISLIQPLILNIISLLIVSEYLYLTNYRW